MLMPLQTFQSIAVLYTLASNGVHGKPTCRHPIILCPSSLVANWGNELRRWLGDRVDPLVGAWTGRSLGKVGMCSLVLAESLE